MSLKPLLVIALLAPILLLVALGACGVGHGDCRLLAVFFPATIVGASIAGANLFLMAAIQSGFYGVVLGLALRRGLFKYALIFLAVLHAVTVSLIMRM